ncbi:Ubiquitin-like protein DskB [Rasamsonia emersonii CBS 393.64]|uniref:Ubiquitin-like protein DskB n=1 Tax=Rasamsonia emersonii (strain ATCC 16479 / CBS 393.64 / IMI 116815) TaxID=1408163 RepID=A0A0F4YKB7_RASE3|nr:Ubiquitin-like protein DskB [Rasamsonia emersonii CBS 393.64]KKA18580.1 Ubiquitin-like protein DskB [Rasamsonia emersonii CBS 393.64]
MADDTTTTEDSSITFHVKASNDAKFTLTLPTSTTVAELKNKLSSSEYADTPADRQRLIYSGRVLKDNETLATYKIKEGNTIHLVKSAASNQRQAPAAQPSTATSGANANQSIPGVPTNIAAGTGNNPLAGLTGARYAGFAQLPGAGMFGPDGGMGPPPDPEAMLSMLENPQVQATMNEALQNPAIIDMMIQQNPMFREMGPAVRQMMQSPEFRRMLTDPNTIRQMAQLQRAMGGLGAFGFGAVAGNTAFPAPGVTNTTPEENRNQQQQQQTNQTNQTNQTPPVNPFLAAGLAGNPFANLFGANPAGGAANARSTTPAGGEQNANATGQGTTGGATQNQQNPFALLFNPALFGVPQTQPGTSDGNAGSQQQQQEGAQAAFNPFNPQTNPFLRDPQLLSNFVQALGGQEAANNPFAGLFGSPPQQDNRPPEERYAEQLRQLNDMGFYEFEKNIEALRRTGGSVQGAVEYLLNHPS